MPKLFEDIAKCANPNCVTNYEKWNSRLEVINTTSLEVRCVYCERSFPANELTLI
jgi:aspartate carbamoyltransferase regulatory subunit